MFGVGKYFALGGGIALALALAWGFRVDHLRADWKTKFTTLSDQSGIVLLATRNANDNPDLKWKDAAAQITDIGESRNAWKRIANKQTAKIKDLGDETVRLKNLNKELRAQADILIAKRAVSIAKLQDQASNPGDRANCVSQIQAANAALDLIYEEGL